MSQVGFPSFPLAPGSQTAVTGNTNLTDADLAGGVIRPVTAAAVITIPDTLVNKHPVTFIKDTASAVSFSAGGTTTIKSDGGNTTMGAQNTSVTLIPDQSAANTYWLIGSLV